MLFNKEWLKNLKHTNKKEKLPDTHQEKDDFFDQEHFERAKMEGDLERKGKLIFLAKRRREKQQQEKPQEASQDPDRMKKGDVVDFNEKKDEKTGVEPGTHKLMYESDEVARRLAEEDIEPEGTKWINEERQE